MGVEILFVKFKVAKKLAPLLFALPGELSGQLKENYVKICEQMFFYKTEGDGKMLSLYK